MNQKRQHRRARRGNVIVLSAFLMIAMMGVLAFAIDLGYLYNTRTEMQRAADASAIAACWELIDEDAAEEVDNSAVLMANARNKATEFVAYNLITQASAALTSDDITIGYIANPSNPSSPFVTTGYDTANAVKIRIRRNATQNGVIPLFFGPVLGVNSATMESEATAAYIMGGNGFKTPTDGSNIPILPYALDQQTWNDMMAGGGTDDYRFDEGAMGSGVSSAPDGIREVNLFPQGIGAPGNRGTIDIGPANNTTNDIKRQVREGISPSDMAAMGGKLEFNSEGKLYLQGDTGISAAVKEDFDGIVGETRIIPIFESATGTGNNCTYTIVKWAGVRVVSVKLTGNNKSLIVQPAVVVTKGTIPSSTARTEYVFSPVWLVR